MATERQDDVVRSLDLEQADLPAQPKPSPKSIRRGSAAVAVREHLAEGVARQHHDTVMSRRLLRDHGARSPVAGRNGFTCGRLHAIEEARAEALRHEFASIWAGLQMKKVRERLKD